MEVAIKPERWHQIEELYHSTLDRARKVKGLNFLKKACAGDDDLRREVESLLAHELSASELLDPVWRQAGRSPARYWCRPVDCPRNGDGAFTR